MVWPSTKCEPSSRIAWRVAVRTAGKPQPLAEAFEDVLRRLARLDDARRNAERPGRGRDEQRVGFHLVVGPVAGRELVLDQPVGGRGIGHAQQRLGEHHEGKALAGRERILAQEILDPAEPAGFRPDRLDEPGRARIDARFRSGGTRRLRQQARGDPFVGSRIGGGEHRQAFGRCGFSYGVRAHRVPVRLDAILSRGRARRSRPAAQPADAARCRASVHHSLFAPPVLALWGGMFFAKVRVKMRKTRSSAALRADRRRRCPIERKYEMTVDLLRLGRIGLLAAASALAATTASAQTPIKFSLDFKFEGPAAPFVVAIDKGYFKAEGPRCHDRYGGRLARADQPRGVGHLRHGLRRHQFADQVPRRQSGHADQGRVHGLQQAAVLDRRPQEPRRLGAEGSRRQEARRAAAGRRLRAVADLREGERHRRLQGHHRQRRISRCASRCWRAARSTPSPASRSRPTST